MVLCGPRLTHRHTCATLIEAGLNVVGICVCDQRKAGLPFSTILRNIKRKGLAVTLSRTTARLLYEAINRTKDRRIFQRLFDEASIHETLSQWHGATHHTTSYSDAESLAWLRARQPDVFVVHTPYWVGKKVRELPATGIVLGGHPGITPEYRGTHAAFRAVYQGHPEDVGCTVFHLDETLDAGDVVAQERIPIEPGDSFVTLGWKGMKRIAELQAGVLADFDRGVPVPRRPVTPPPDSVFDHPTLREYIHYGRIQDLAR